MFLMIYNCILCGGGGCVFCGFDLREIDFDLIFQCFFYDENLLMIRYCG